MAHYQTFLLADALAPRPPVVHLVQGIIPAGSVSIFYGYPGSLKSLLIADMAMAIVTGSTWLQGMPGSNNLSGFKTKKSCVLWIDLDNGNDVTANRFAAFSRSYQAPLDSPFFWMSYPTPTIQFCSTGSAVSLQAHIQTLPVKPELIVIDTLLRAAHVKDENSSEMDTVLNNIHKMAEDLKSAIILISHSKKENMGRAGNGLRGHSSIEGGVDAVFQVKREDHKDLVEVENQKARRKPVDKFTARWTFLLDAMDNETLSVARFWRADNAPSKTQQTMTALETKICSHLTACGKTNKTDLYKVIGGYRTNFQNSLDALVKDGKIVQTAGAYNAVFYEIP